MNNMNKIIGFIGSGKMAQSMIQGMITSEAVFPNQIIASAVTEETLQKVSESYGIMVTTDNGEVARKADFLILAVKPHLYSVVIEEIKGVIKPNVVIITIAAGTSLDFMESQLSKEVKVIRAMPNTPSLVGAGMTAICPNQSITKQELNVVIDLFNSFGKTECVEEKLMDAIPAISGSSPAYVFMMIEALADGGVMQGFQRDVAKKLAAQAVLGAAKMVLETDMHPAVLKDNVCTPGGATIEAVASLEKNHFRATILDAMDSCTNKAMKLKAEND
jgi:pyrroline-5-carboxylate reductase